MQTTFIIKAIAAIDQALTANEAEIAELDRAIGDGDYYINIKRGAVAILAMKKELANLPADATLQKFAQS